METKLRFVLAVFFILGLSPFALAVGGCGGSGAFRDQDGYVQNPTPSVSPGPTVVLPPD